MVLVVLNEKIVAAVPPLEIQFIEEINPRKDRRKEPLKRTTGTIFNSRPEIKPTVEINPKKEGC